MAYEIDKPSDLNWDQHQTRNDNPVEHDQKGSGHKDALCTLI